jgi:glycosyltransferase involved in cell wall biosynthesis
MSKVTIYTQAYNAEKTVARTIESVLAQTFQDFTYYVVDNGSLDTTGAIIREFAGRDGRVVHRANAKNHVWEPGTHFIALAYEMFLAHEHEDGSYFCMVDADDEYKPDFLERALAFIRENQLDLAACGSDFLDAVSGNFLGARALGQDLLLEGDAFGSHFPIYHEFMRTYWGKLYSVTLLRFLSSENPHDISYGSDTLLVQGAFRRARRVGILAGTSHRYHVSPQSVSYGLDAKRVRGDRILFDAAKDFLMTKAGSVCPANEYFLYSVYLNAIKDTLQVLATAKIPDSEKMEHVRYLKVEMDEIQRFFSTTPKPAVT